jgi:hypothetical protein
MARLTAHTALIAVIGKDLLRQHYLQHPHTVARN